MAGLDASSTTAATPTGGDGKQRAIVLSGGGARAAYQVGLLCHLGRNYPDLRFPIVTGTSAGAINAVFLAAHPGGLAAATRDLAEVWRQVTFDDIFRTDTPWLAANAVRWLGRLATGGRLGRGVRGLLDTEPLRRFLTDTLGDEGELEGIGRNIAAGRLRCAALTTVQYATGRTITWVEGDRVPSWRREQRQGRATRLTIEHVMASAALPLVFPAVELEGTWYGDGGIRLAAPISPALHLGADAVLAVSTRYRRSLEEEDEPYTEGYPPPAQIVGNLVNAIFLDVLDRDVRRLERSNRVIRNLPPEDRAGWRPIDLLVLRPSADLGRLVADFEPRLPRAFRWLTRGLGTRETKSPDFLSLLMFQPEYLQRLIEIGERDAEARADEIAAWVEASGGT